MLGRLLKRCRAGNLVTFDPGRFRNERLKQIQTSRQLIGAGAGNQMHEQVLAISVQLDLSMLFIGQLAERSNPLWSHSHNRNHDGEFGSDMLEG